MLNDRGTFPSVVRVAFVADVHSNLHAFGGVLEHVGRAPESLAPEHRAGRCACGRGSADVDALYHVGDLVGYGANPAETVDIVRALRVQGVVGNHDWAALHEDPVPFNPAAFAGLLHSRRVLGHDARTVLKELPRRLDLRLDGLDVELVHGSPADPLWEYVFPDDARRVLGEFVQARATAPGGAGIGPSAPARGAPGSTPGGRAVLVLGHTHVPVTERLDAPGRPAAMLLNPGSVGQPRDGDPRASFAVLDTATGETELHRVYYDIQGAARAIRSAGLPSSLAERLFAGR